MSLVPKECNIILLGETGCGKSLFINSFANYARYDNFVAAVASKKPITLIPSTFNIADKNGDDHLIEVGEKDEENERSKIGKSFTVKCNSYQFNFADMDVKLIDTPGVADTKGEAADRENIANILSFINNFDNLHAIAIVIKNTETKMTDKLNYCLKQLLTNLNKTAAKNIVFVLTFSKGSDFKPGNVKDVLKLFMEKELKDSTLILEPKIMYCVDNKSYEYLMAINNYGFEFKPMIIESQKNNWKESFDEITRLMHYVATLTPYKVKDTKSLNDVRNFIKVIRPIFPKIFQSIDLNANFINAFKMKLKAAERAVNMESLRVDDINIIPLDRATTFCISPYCRQVIRIGNEEKYHYPKQCCQGCLVNNSMRWWCMAIAWNGYCKECGCHKSEHERRFFKTEKISSYFFSEEDRDKMKIATGDKEKLEMEMQLTEEKSAELLREKKVLEDAEKKFAKFLQTHELVKPPEQKSSLNDAVNYYCSTEMIVIEKYEKEIENMESISIEEFYQLKGILLNLPINGAKIKEIIDANEKGVKVNFSGVVTQLFNKKIASIICAT